MRTQLSPFQRLRALRIASGALGVALLAAGWTSGAVAQEADTSRVVVRAADATDPDAVDLVYGWSGDPAAAAASEVTENGDIVSASVVPSNEAGWGNDVVFVVDSSTTTDQSALLVNVEEALRAWTTTLAPGQRVAIITAGSATQVLRGLSSDPARLDQAITDLTPGGEGALLAGVVRAGAILDEEVGTVPTVVVLTDGVSDSAVSRDQAEGALQSSGAALYVVGLQTGSLDEGTFRGMAEATGGRMVVTDDPEQVGALVEEIKPEIVQQFAATWASPESSGIQDFSVTVDDTTSTGSYITGSQLIGAERLVPRPPVEPSGIAFFHSGLGKSLAFAAAALACVLLVYGLVITFVRDDRLSVALEPYSDSYVAARDDEEEEENVGGQQLAQTALMQRAVQLTEQFAERQGFLTRLERKLEQADVPLRAGEAMFFYLASSILAVVLVLAVSQNLMATLIISVLVIIIPPAILNFRASAKKKAFEALLPDTLQLLSSTLRAGYSMMQGVEAVSQEAAEPMGKELRRVVTEARLGRPLETSLEGIAERMDSADFAWAVMAIKIQREVGGNLAELLLTVAETMTARERLRRDIRSLTAEGRISAYVLIALPIGLGVFLYVINPDYIQLLFDDFLGQAMLAAAVVMIIVGYFWMMKIIKIEI